MVIIGKKTQWNINAHLLLRVLKVKLPKYSGLYKIHLECVFQKSLRSGGKVGVCEKNLVSFPEIQSLPQCYSEDLLKRHV